ncbi:MAG: transposase [Candidatus Electryonea clarkiae]|nr:transposase [Candidatus Electryonea clarkiae]MDP8285206.1 transposase [Candidatus Electryonea clarkiae]
MVVYRRYLTDNPDELFFFTFVTHNRIPVFKSRDDYLKIWQEWRNVSSKADGELIAYVFLPDHIHLLIKQGIIPFSEQVRSFKRKMNMLFVEKKGTIWQARFWEHKIWDDDDYRKHVDYIHFNPVKHNLVRNPYDWKYSSFRKFVEEGIYPPDWSSELDFILPGGAGEV